MTPVVLSRSGVLLPTQAASTQWIFGSSLVLRLYFVSPPDPHSIGSPRDSSLRNNSQRVAFTAVASLSGALACAKIFLKRSGFFFKKSRMSFVPFARLHFSHATQRLLTLLSTYLALGTMCSTC